MTDQTPLPPAGDLSGEPPGPPANDPDAVPPPGSEPTQPIAPAPTAAVVPTAQTPMAVQVPTVAEPPAVPPPPAAPPPPPPAGAARGRPPAYTMVTVFDETVTMNQLWGIPLIGVFVRGILLIPHAIILAFYGMLVFFLTWVTWIPVLINGRYPAWGYDLVGGFMRWYTRVYAYGTLMAATYPPFSPSAPHDVDVAWDLDQEVPRWAGIPLLGLFVRSLLLIPHFIVLWALGIVANFVNLVAWIPVLLYGRYPAWGYLLVGGYLRWMNRVGAYLLLMTGPYPPFKLED
ncbi:MAG: hypothetical protein H6Q36_789 [Chloroflexi bacterium]|nr:hypothetical protein [Chloroflexota bacterium]